MSSERGHSPGRFFFGVKAQLLRYALSGGTAALLYAAVYWILSIGLGVWPILANFSAWIAALISSYILHSRWTFGIAATGQRGWNSRIFFSLINVGGLLLNSVWVWIIVEVLGGNVLLPLLPILGVTPWIMFYAMRRWAFR
jgi:putative flippase GtrA